MIKIETRDFTIQAETISELEECVSLIMYADAMREANRVTVLTEGFEAIAPLYSEYMLTVHDLDTFKQHAGNFRQDCYATYYDLPDISKAQARRLARLATIAVARRLGISNGERAEAINESKSNIARSVFNLRHWKGPHLINEYHELRGIMGLK